MKRRCMVGLMLAAWLVAGCKQNSRQLVPPTMLQRQVALGEKIFAEKQCGSCHIAKQETLTPQGEKAPDLTSVFLAMDTLFVKAHLQFTELSKMPPIELSLSEISALTQYVGALHGKTNMDPNLKNPDGLCPICGAPVSFIAAEARHLKFTFDNKDYYFECPDCKSVFERDPVLQSQSGYALAK